MSMNLPEPFAGAVPNAVYPTAGQGLVLGPDGKIPTSILQPWMTGDYKVSAIATDHADPGGGMWLLCDSTAIDTKYGGLITLIGANRPDARGRTLVMKGTNASVNSLLANEGAPVGNRRPYHRTSNTLGTSHTLTLPNHVHNITYGNGGFNLGNPGGTDQGLGTSATYGTSNPTSNPAINGSVSLTGSIGTNNANDPLDTAAFLVPGNLFIHT